MGEPHLHPDPEAVIFHILVQELDLLIVLPVLPIDPGDHQDGTRRKLLVRRGIENILTEPDCLLILIPCAGNFCLDIADRVRIKMHLLRILKDILRLIRIPASRQCDRPVSEIQAVAVVLPDSLFKCLICICPDSLFKCLICICVLPFFQVGFAGDIKQVTPQRCVGFLFFDLFIFRRIIDGFNRPV